MTVLLGACASDADADLEARVAELEQENAELRAELAEREADADDGTAGSTTTSTSTTSTTAPAPVPGSLERPIELGRRVRVGDWVYKVLAFEPNVDKLVTALDPSNEPAGRGKVYARLRVRAVYQGDGSGDPRRLTINLVSPSGKTIGDVSVCCRPRRRALNDQAETFKGGVADGWIYYAINARDADGGKFLGFDPDGDFPGVPGGIGFFRVN